MTRLTIPGGLDMTCHALSAAWELYYPEMESQVQQCVADTRELALNSAQGEIEDLPLSCPTIFNTAFVDGQVDGASIAGCRCFEIGLDSRVFPKLIWSDLKTGFYLLAEALAG